MLESSGAPDDSIPAAAKLHKPKPAKDASQRCVESSRIDAAVFGPQ
jgi:hypothetical protein